ncbi:MAG: copper chaperone PCu(A)C [Propionibacteriaceae bacterium]|nr:copper chaperone PCu(A)C [Propionibacteriaceae bacterium]
MRRLIAVLASLLLSGALTGCAPKVTSAPAAAIAEAQLSVEGAWIRTTTRAKDLSKTSAFMTIVNPGDADLRLTSADCAGAGVVQLHEMVMQSGKMVMQETKDGIPVPAGSQSHLTPGGFHIMLMKLRREFEVGDRVELNLHFSDGGTLAVSAQVKEFVEAENQYHSPLPAATASS